MNQQEINNPGKSKRPSKKISVKKENGQQRKLDKAIEMTFPASDPIAIIQPASDKDPAKEAAEFGAETGHSPRNQR